MMVKIYRIEITVMLFILLQPVVVWATPFSDMQNAWYRHKEAVEFLVQRNVLQGYEDGTFRPIAPINRAEFLKIVFKGKSAVQPVQRRCFSDVNPDEWYAPYVCAAKQRGIVQGYANGTFQPGKLVNTAEAIKILLNAYDKSIQEASGEHWYRPYVEYLDTNEILGAHAYVPWDTLTRVHAADLLWRVLRFQEEQIIPRYSQGCGKAKPALPDFPLTVPASYAIHDPVPLLIAFHGRTNSNEDVRAYYGFDREAANAIIAYPAARKNSKGTFVYEEEEDRQFDTLVHTLSKQYCIDLDRIFVAGHSLGGWFANKIACLHGDVVRASASLGSSGFTGTCTGPAAAMILHNPNDRLAPFSGSNVVRDARVIENSCAATTHSTAPESFRCLAYEGCSVNPVVFCPHQFNTDHRGVYYPHNWPRETGREMWEFFETLQ